MTDQSVPFWVIIPAAGLGQRMQSEIPKQYLKINNKTVIEHTLECFINHPKIAGVVVVKHSEDSYWDQLHYKFQTTPVFTTEGGVDRNDSVLQGIKYLMNIKQLAADTWVMVHDAARPCLPKTDIDALLSIRQSDCIGGILASPVRDTMKRVSKINEDQSDSLMVSHTESREGLWHALTPQMFRLSKLFEAIRYCQNNNIMVTDDCSAMAALGLNPIIVEVSHNNIKVTYADDIALASFFIKQNNN